MNVIRSVAYDINKCTSCYKYIRASRHINPSLNHIVQNLKIDVALRIFTNNACFLSNSSVF